jgi:hypothetical protein
MPHSREGFTVIGAMGFGILWTAIRRADELRSALHNFVLRSVLLKQPCKMLEHHLSGMEERAPLGFSRDDEVVASKYRYNVCLDDHMSCTSPRHARTSRHIVCLADGNSSAFVCGPTLAARRTSHSSTCPLRVAVLTDALPSTSTKSPQCCCPGLLRFAPRQLLPLL